MATNWFNNDGLLVKYGTNEATAGRAGEVAGNNGNTRIIELRLSDLTVLTDATQTVLDENVFVPKNARIEWVDVLNVTAATSGGAATLDLGLIRRDQTTELDYDGLLAAAPLSDWNALGETKHYMVGVTGAGALMGTVLANSGYLVATWNVGAFTAGAIDIRIGFSFP